EVIQEVRDSESVKNLQLALSAGRLIVGEPETKYREVVSQLAEKLSVLKKLSSTDLELLALTSELLEKCSNVVVISDDTALRKVATQIGAKTMTIKYRGRR
ncbi:MAG: hypothetical protein QXE63_02210, partial [Zestosphaera sp.]